MSCADVGILASAHEIIEDSGEVDLPVEVPEVPEVPEDPEVPEEPETPESNEGSGQTESCTCKGA